MTLNAACDKIASVVLLEKLSIRCKSTLCIVVAWRRSGYVHTALFSFLSVFVDKNAAANEGAMKMIGAHIAPARACCSPPFQNKSFFASVKKASVATLNTIVINSILTKQCDAFSNVSVFGLKMDCFQSTLFSNSCLFIVFSKSSALLPSNVNLRH